MAEAQILPVSDERYLTIQEVCAYLQVSAQTVFRWMRAGKVAFYRFGGSTRFRRADLDALAERVAPGGAPRESPATARCPACGRAGLVAGTLRSTGLVSFVPKRTRFFVLADSHVGVAARVCPHCGHVALFADGAKLGKLLTEADRAAAEAGAAETAELEAELPEDAEAALPDGAAAPKEVQP